jgi:hypothetical protein
MVWKGGGGGGLKVVAFQFWAKFSNREFNFHNIIICCCSSQSSLVFFQFGIFKENVIAYKTVVEGRTRVIALRILHHPSSLISKGTNPLVQYSQQLSHSPCLSLISLTCTKLNKCRISRIYIMWSVLFFKYFKRRKYSLNNWGKKKRRGNG